MANETPAAHSPAPAAPRERQHAWMDLLLGIGAVACWVALFQLPTLFRASTLPERPFLEQQVENVDGVQVHLEHMPGGALQPDNRQLAAEVKQLGQALGMDSRALHIYRFADRYRSLDLLCQGTLLAPDSQCLGVKPDE